MLSVFLGVDVHSLYRLAIYNLAHVDGGSSLCTISGQEVSLPCRPQCVGDFQLLPDQRAF